MFRGRTRAGQGERRVAVQGTRVPVRALFENLEDGARLDDFLEWFPGVSRKQAEDVLRHAERSLAVA
jgi:uncharacterized protein (DUF433 family)